MAVVGSKARIRKSRGRGREKERKERGRGGVFKRKVTRPVENDGKKRI